VSEISRMTDRQTKLMISFAALAVVLLVLILHDLHECGKVGGHFVRTLLWFTCL